MSGWKTIDADEKEIWMNLTFFLNFSFFIEIFLGGSPKVKDPNPKISSFILEHHVMVVFELEKFFSKL